MKIVEEKNVHANRIAQCISEEIKLRQRFNQHLVLGLATGFNTNSIIRRIGKITQ